MPSETSGATPGPEAPRPTAPWIGRSALFGVAALVAVTCIGAWLLYREAFDQASADALRAVQILEEHADKIVGGHLASLEQIELLVRSQDWRSPSDVVVMHERLRTIDEARPEVQSLWVFDDEGDVVATSEALVPPRVNFADRDYFQAAVNGEESFIGEVVFGRVTREYVFNLMRRVANDDGTLRGALVVSLYPAYFSKFYGTIGQPGDSVMLLLASGSLLARHPTPPGDLTMLAGDAAFMRHVATASGKTFSADGVFASGEYMFAGRPVVGLPMYVVYGASRARIIGQWRDQVVAYSLFAVPVLLGLVGLGWIAYRQARIADRSRHTLHHLNRDLEGRVRERAAALAESDQVLRAAIEAAELGTWEIEIETGRSRWSEGMRMILGLPEGMTDSERAERVAWFHPDDRDVIAERLTAHVERGEPYRLQFRFVRPDGEVRWLASFGNTLPATAGRPARIVGVIQDITERKRHEERQRLLMAELDHRVRNMMAVIQALARQSLKGEPDDAKVFTARIASLARVHALLAENRWAGLRAIIEGTAETYRASADAPAFQLSGPDVQLSPKAAQGLALVLQELSGNAAKYGALSRPGGRIELDWSCIGTGDAHRLILQWRERNGPPVRPPERKGFGSRFIETTVNYDLRGSVTFDFAADGLMVTLDMPLPAMKAEEPVDPAAAAPARERTGPAPNAVLHGRRVLVVEDEQFVAQDVAAALAGAGAIVLGPAGRCGDALDILASATPDAAVLDVNLAGELVWPVAEALHERGVPFLLVTGYEPRVLPQAWRTAALLTKPVDRQEMLARLAQLIATTASADVRTAG